MNGDSIHIRDATQNDLQKILILNREFEHFLSPLTLEQLTSLHDRAAYHRIAESDEGLAGFLLGFREQCNYDSVNYRWFDNRFKSFLYIDRVVASASRQGIGTALYKDFINVALDRGVPFVCCEYNLVPFNDPSARFHAKFGFQELGTQHVGEGHKRVSLQVLNVESVLSTD